MRTVIIAGGFDHYTKGQAAIERLRAAGLPDDDFCEFRVNPAGEHDTTPIGGDHAKSEGAKTAQKGAASGGGVGAAVGAAAGVAATPFLGPAGLAAGAGTGAYVGSLVGSLRKVNKEPQPDNAAVRPAEAMVAVNAGDVPCAVPPEEIVRIFEECGAHQVELAEGQWSDGEWSDFNPAAAPQLVGGSDLRARGEPPRH